ncbi:2377_t:CDS:2, partial [Cetraspora pellucida]
MHIICILCRGIESQEEKLDKEDEESNNEDANKNRLVYNNYYQKGEEL